MKTDQQEYQTKRPSERGNVFTILLAAVALTAVLGTQIFSTLSGPVTSLTRISNKTIADTQMLAASQIVIMDATNLAASGDCDADGAIEPREWRTGAGPTGGGLIPTTIGAPVTDPWGTDYGYCVWDTGALRNNAGCGGAGQNRLEGSPNPSAGNTDTQFVIALVSAGPNRQFNTTCADYVDTTTPILTQGGDDVVYKYTYAEASVATSSLWYLQDGDPSTAEIQKDLQIGTDITVDAGAGLINALGANITGRAVAGGGVTFGDQTDVLDADCSASTAGLIRYNSTSSTLEVCDGTGATGWQPAGASGGATAFDTTATCAAPSDAGNVRYNNVTLEPEFCDGTSWAPFELQSSTVTVVAEPLSDNTVNITGPCSGTDCPYAYSTWRTFTIRNTGSIGLTLEDIHFHVEGNVDIEHDWTRSDCHSGGTYLEPAGKAGNSCKVVIRVKSNVNGEFSAIVNANIDLLPTRKVAFISGTVSGFTCRAGNFAGGGILTDFPGSACSGSDPTTGSLILQPGRCGCETNEPICGGSNSDCIFSPAVFDSTNGNHSDTIPTTTTPEQYTANAVSGYRMVVRAAYYCDRLVLNGYDDWFLPSADQMRFLRGSPLNNGYSAGYNFYQNDLYAVANTFNAFSRILEQTGTALHMSNFTSIPGLIETVSTDATNLVRCVRRHNVALPTAQIDDNPEYMFQSFAENIHSYYLPNGATNEGLVVRLYSNSTSNNLTTEPFPIRGINTPASFSVSGSGSPLVSVNGGAFVSSGTIPVGGADIRLRITSPSTTGTVHRGFVQIGSDELPIELQAYTTDPANVKRIFLTSATYVPSIEPFTGRSGADTICRNLATTAALPSANTYLSMLGTQFSSGIAPFSHFTHRFENVNGELLANNIAEFIRIGVRVRVTDENGNTTNSANIWTGAGFDPHRFSGTSSVNCGSWGITTTTGAAANGHTTTRLGDNMFYAACTNSGRIICIGPN